MGPAASAAELPAAAPAVLPLMFSSSASWSRRAFVLPSPTASATERRRAAGVAAGVASLPLPSAAAFAALFAATMAAIAVSATEARRAAAALMSASETCIGARLKIEAERLSSLCRGGGGWEIRELRAANCAVNELRAE